MSASGPKRTSWVRRDVSCYGSEPATPQYGLGATDFLFRSVLRLRLLSRQPFGPQPFQILAQGLLLLFVFGQWSIRWTEHVRFIFAFAHDVIFLSCGLRRLSCLRRSSYRDFCWWSDTVIALIGNLGSL